MQDAGHEAGVFFCATDLHCWSREMRGRETLLARSPEKNKKIRSLAGFPAAHLA
jgi:hypothetical protein